VALLMVQNRVEVHCKHTGDLVPFSPRRVLPRFVKHEGMYGYHPPSHKGKYQRVTLAYRLLVVIPSKVTMQSKPIL
jgi:hypothetical protein